MAGETGICVKRVDFSNPQGGKGGCDRKAATVKAHVRRYVNEGYNVVTAQEFHDTMLSHRGINSVQVALVTTSSDQSQQVIASDYSELWVKSYYNCCRTDHLKHHVL